MLSRVHRCYAALDTVLTLTTSCGHARVSAQASALVGRPVRGVAVFLSPRRGHHLFSLLRPELVESNPVPLSSDAFTGFGWHDAAVHNREVGDATDRMMGPVIDRFTRELQSRRLRVFNGAHLTALLHERGAAVG